MQFIFFFFFSSRRRHTRCLSDWSSDVCSSDLNRDKAMRVLRARLLEREMAAQQAEQAAARLAQVGSGQRAEKIRTYNFPQDRVTDHRVGLTKGNLPGVLGGELDEFTAALEAEEKRMMLEAAEPVGR